ncbi:MAG: ribosome biogenesis GTPase YlqF [Acholeplasmatales bacterium]|jgi:ribosome biogenesis GTPase A|nr:ribosome biogenesis GTPase YlqF [Acholeplasmatales bacterium]
MINWFPGHMKKTLDELATKLKVVDLVYLLVDGRCPLSSINYNLIDQVKTKQIIVLINKADLTDKKALTNQVKKIPFPTLIIDAKKGTNVHKIIPLTFSVMKDKIAALKAKQLMVGKFRALVLGVPNVGKSTLINRLTGSHLKVENRPGVTLSFTWTRLNDYLELLDSPGVMMSKLDYDTGMKMVLIGSIKDDIIDLETVCIYLINYLSVNYPQVFFLKYGLLTANLTPHEIIDHLCEKCKFYLNKDDYDYERAYSFLLKEFRSGHLGLISLDGGLNA